MSETQTIRVPDIGDFSEVEVIEVLIKAGDSVNAEDALITIESDKASMDIPSPAAGKIVQVLLESGARVSAGDAIATLETEAAATTNSEATAEKATVDKAETSAEEQTETTPESTATEQPAAASQETTGNRANNESAAPAAYRPPPVRESDEREDSEATQVHASPSVRRFARELGINLAMVHGSGRKQRITKDDVKAFTRSVMANGHGADSAARLPTPEVDFSQYGKIETWPLNRIRRLAGQYLQNSWQTIPQVTQFNAADISDLEAFRQSEREAAEAENIKLTLIPFLLKAIVAVLEKHPEFNASLSASGTELIIKRYFHIGVAVNTDNGLVVPVIRDVDQKGLFELARAIADVSERARNNRLKRDEMQGGCFTLSSLGGIGGSFFTPIVNPPEVAILGVSRAAMQPVHKDGGFVPRLILPYALTYDHRVIDGVAGARFSESLREVLSDIRQILL